MRRFALFIVIISLTALCSCGGGADDAEILSALDTLAPKAHELYTIVYGDALPHGEIEDDGYARVSDGAKYQSIEQIKAALGDVFTAEYCEIIYNTAFGGITVDEGTIGAKFGEDETGFYVNPSVTENFAAPREFDLSEAKIIKKNRFAAIVSIPHEDGDLEVTLTLIDGKWLIDSPMF